MNKLAENYLRDVATMLREDTIREDEMAEKFKSATKFVNTHNDEETEIKADDVFGICQLKNGKWGMLFNYPMYCINAFWVADDTMYLGTYSIGGVIKGGASDNAIRRYNSETIDSCKIETVISKEGNIIKY